MDKRATQRITIEDNAGQTIAPGITVLFDVSRLANTRLKHSGISRYAREMLHGLSNVRDVRVQPVLLKPTDLNKGDFRDDLAGFSDYLGMPVVLPDQVRLLGIKTKTVLFSPYGPLEHLPNMQPTVRFVTIHDILHISRSDLYLADNARNHIDSVLQSLSVTDYVLTDSEYTRMELLQVLPLNPDNVTAEPLGVSRIYRKRSAADVRRFCKANDLTPGRYFVMFAQRDPRKNVASTLEGIRRFLIENPDTDMKFVTIGSGVNTEHLQKAFEDSAMPADKVQMLVAPEDEEVALAYSGARAMLFPSLGEGFGLPPLEAMSCGCPVITSSLTSLPEVVRTAGLYITPTEPDDVKGAIAALSHSDQLADELARRALEESKGYSWKQAAETAAKLFTRATETEKATLTEVSTLHSDMASHGKLSGRDLLGHAPEWIERGGALVPSGGLALYGNTLGRTQLFVDTQTQGVHAIYTEITHPGQRFGLSVILRPIGNDRAVIWATQLSGGQSLDKCELYVDLGSYKIERSREEGDMEIVSQEVSGIGDGWARIELEIRCPEVEDGGLRLTVGGRPANLRTSAYTGSGGNVFELLSARITGEETAQADATPDEPELGVPADDDAHSVMEDALDDGTDDLVIEIIGDDGDEDNHDAMPAAAPRPTAVPAGAGMSDYDALDETADADDGDDDELRISFI